MSDGSKQMCKNTSYIDFCPFGAQLDVSLYIYTNTFYDAHTHMCRMSGLLCLFWACSQLNFNLSLSIGEPFWFRTFCAAHAHFCLLPGPRWVWPSAVSQFSILMNHTLYLMYFLWRLMRTLVSAICLACSEPGQASGLQWVFEEATLATLARLNLRYWCTFCNQPLSAHQPLLRLNDIWSVNL